MSGGRGWPRRRPRAHAGLSLLAGVALLLAGTACGGPLPHFGPTATAVPTPTPVPTATPVPVTVPPAAQTVVGLALADAARRLGASDQAVRITRLEPRTWPDLSLGCPEPGLMYGQVVTPGYILTVVGAGKTLEYHTDATGRVALCAER